MSRRPTSAHPVADPFARLEPPGIAALRVAWDALRIPGPPAELELTPEESRHPDPAVRFARRTVAQVDCGGGDAVDCDTLALVDKASPHALHDLMLTEVSPTPKSTAVDVAPATGRTLWRAGAAFVRFCTDLETARAHGLAGGAVRLALNCDPHTRDRESVQAAKQFHLHLLCWTDAELAPLADAAPLGAHRDPRLRRQALDPLTFLGARLIAHAVGGLASGIPGVRLRVAEDAAALADGRPLGCVLELPGWELLETPAFETLMRGIHARLEDLGARLLEAFTDHREPPPPWTRHALLPAREIAARLAALDLDPDSASGLRTLAGALRTLAPVTARRLARSRPDTRKHLMTLIQPSYAITLQPEHDGDSEARVLLAIQPKLFSGTGGAGLLSLGGVPSVRILRGQGRYTREQWRQRARFQGEFARRLRDSLADTEPGLTLHPTNVFDGDAWG